MRILLLALVCSLGVQATSRKEILTQANWKTMQRNKILEANRRRLSYAIAEGHTVEAEELRGYIQAALQQIENEKRLARSWYKPWTWRKK